MLMRFFLFNTPNANGADHSVGARDESLESEASEASVFCYVNASPEKPCFVDGLVCFISLCLQVFVLLNATRRDRNCPTFALKYVRAHCYCASLVRTLFIGHARATSFSSARTDSKTQQNIERMTFALTWYANIFVGCSVTPTFFSADHFLF